MKKNSKEIEIKVGLFVTLGLGLLLSSILILGGSSTLFAKKVSYHSYVPSAEGLIPGARVVLSGIQVGNIDAISLDPSNQNINVTYSIGKKYTRWVRADSSVEIATQGILGDKYLSIQAGNLALPVLSAQSEIPVRRGQSIQGFLNSGETLMLSLNNIAQSLDRILYSLEQNTRPQELLNSLAITAQNLTSVTSQLDQKIGEVEVQPILNHLHSILRKVDQGNGTLGALLNDPSLYDDTKTLLSGGNRNRLLRNLIRQTLKDSERHQESYLQKSQEITEK
jgi:phospholipid/cholesterol/gamma-HCH transport system substrate-binding protein